MFPDSSIFPHFCIPHDVWCFKSFVLNARILKPILGNRVAGMDQHKSLGISRSCDVRDVLGEVDGAAKVVGSDANSHWLVCFALWILGGNEKKHHVFVKKLRCQNCEWTEFSINFHTFPGALFFFFRFFFQEFGCGPGGCHPFIFECMMPLRRKGMKGREWGSNTSKPPPRQRFALNSPISLPGEHWGPHLQAIFDISFQLLDGFRPFKICTQWCTGWDVWLGVVPYGRWDLCDVSAFGDWYLDAVDVGFCPRRFPDVTAMELASLPFGIESDMQKQWKNTCLMLRRLHLCRYDAGQTEKHIEYVVRWVVKPYLSDLSCVVLMFFFFPNVPMISIDVSGLSCAWPLALHSLGFCCFSGSSSDSHGRCAHRTVVLCR